MYEILQNDINISRIALVCYVPAGTGRKIHRDRPAHGLAFQCSGSRRYVFSNGKTVTAEKNSIVYLPRGASYTVEDIRAGDCYAVNLTAELPDPCAPFAVTARNAAHILELFKTAEHIWTTKTAGYMLKCKSLAYEILYSLQREWNEAYIDRRKSELISAAVSYIHGNYLHADLRISELAKMCHITPEYFRKLFKGIYGVSPAEYISDLRLERARELLLSGQYSVTESMFLSGYDDPAYFSHRFRKKYGVSPSGVKDDR